jgi:hypothetical protein
VRQDGPWSPHSKSTGDERRGGLVVRLFGHSQGGGQADLVGESDELPEALVCCLTRASPDGVSDGT